MHASSALLLLALTTDPTTPGVADALATAASLRDAVARGDVETLVKSIHPSGLRVGDGVISYDQAAKEIRSKGKLYAKYFDPKRRRDMWGESVVPSSDVFCSREWFERYPAPVADVVEHRGSDGRLFAVIVAYRRAKDAAENESAPSFSFCEYKGRWMICFPPDDI